jgi:hypothetical protein
MEHWELTGLEGNLSISGLYFDISTRMAVLWQNSDNDVGIPAAAALLKSSSVNYGKITLK